MSSNNMTGMKNLVTCGFCSQLYDDPRLLPCSHTYCFRCINQIICKNKIYFSCPSCNQSKMTQDDINSFPSNEIIHDIVELYVLMQHSPMCSNCDLSQSEYICDICQTHYCSECYQTIHAARALQSHQKMSINQKLSEIRLCNTHKDEKLKYWCQQCHLPVCSDCLLIEHKDHTYSLINKTAKQVETKIETDLEMIQSSLNDKIKQADEVLYKINLDTESNQIKVKKSITFLRQIIDEYEKQILQNIENFQKEGIQQIEIYKIKLENQFKYLDLQKKSLDLFISFNDKIRLLKNKNQFSDYINQTNEILEKFQIPSGIDYYINEIEQSENIKEQILQYITITEASKQIIPMDTDERTNIEKFIHLYQQNEELNLNGKSLTDQNIHLIIQILENNTKMVTLNLSNNQIGPEGIHNLADALQYNKILTTLDLSNNQISDDGAKYLANLLKTNTILNTLYLYDNGISEQGTQYLTDALQYNITLAVLDLQSNRINYLGAQHLADVLRKNNTLKTLYLSNNQIGNQGVTSIANALQQNKTLTALTLSDNQIDHEAKRRVIEMLKTNTRLAVYW